MEPSVGHSQVLLLLGPYEGKHHGGEVVPARAAAGAALHVAGLLLAAAHKVGPHSALPLADSLHVDVPPELPYEAPLGQEAAGALWDLGGGGEGVFDVPSSIVGGRE